MEVAGRGLVLNRVVFYLRWVFCLLWIPASIIAGLIVTDLWQEEQLRWHELYASMHVPVIGLLGAWVIAPKYKLAAVTVHYFVILALGIVLGPYGYPPGHPLEYTDFTWLPVIAYSLVGAAILSAFFLASRQSGKSLSD